MKILKSAVIFFIGLIVSLVVVGFTLTSTYKVERQITINSSAEHVFSFVGDFEKWKSWGVWFERDPNMKVFYSGNAFELNHKSSWESESQGNGSMTLTALMPNQKIQYLLEFPDMGMSSVGTMTFIEENGKTTVTWSDAGDMGNDIVGRYFIFFLDDMLGPDFEAGLQNLKRISEQ